MDSADLLVEQGLLQQGLFPIPNLNVKIVSHGVIFQEACYNGVPYDVTVSWLQKAIRRGLKDQAAYCAYEIFRLGKIFRSHLLNRLAIIASEDIGPAQPGLIRRVEKIYDSLKEKNNDGSTPSAEFQQETLDLVCLLAGAVKSRIANLLVHLVDQPLELELEDHNLDLVLLEKVASALHQASSPSDQNTIVLHYQYDGVDISHHKSLPVYGVWQQLLDQSTGDIYYSDIVALCRIYMNTKDKVHLVHAICLLHFRPPMKFMVRLDQTLLRWDQVASSNFSILDPAIDMHTKWGRKILGRGLHHFLMHGAHLENWRPQPGEVVIREIMLQSASTPTKSIGPTESRDYQNQIVDQCLDYFQKEQAGWLVMACGTGKTRTAFWIYHALMPDLTVVIVPYLEILSQFRSAWDQMLQASPTSPTFHCGIMASLSGPVAMSANISYAYIRKESEWRTFIGVKRHKILYVTYASLPTLLKWNPVPDFVICDEAHHKPNLPFMCRTLKLSATPPAGVTPDQIIGYYHLNEAIKDNYLTDYRIHIMDPTDPPEDHLDELFSTCNKVIIYASKVDTAKKLYNICARSVFTCFLMDSKTTKEQRNEMYQVFAEQGTKCAIFNCAVLGEGVDLPQCDGIYIHSGYNAPHRVVQAFGRPLRLYSGKDLAHIFIVGNKDYQKKLQAMSTYDVNVYDKVI